MIKCQKLWRLPLKWGGRYLGEIMEIKFRLHGTGKGVGGKYMPVTAWTILELVR